MRVPDMKVPFSSSSSPLALWAVFAALISAGSGQSTRPPQKAQEWAAPLTSQGQPDLGGVWKNTWATPFERPKELAGREFLTDAEVAEFKRRAKRLFKDQDGDYPVGDSLFMAVLANPEHYRNPNVLEGSAELMDQDFDNRTSLVIDPPDGRIPPMTAAGKERVAAYNAVFLGRRHTSEVKELTPEQRCITYGVPRIGIYGFTPEGFQQIIQSPGYVMILMAGIHDARIIPLDGRPHLPPSIRTWNGDSRGHWEGKTLVVDTTNFSPKSFFRGSTENLHLVERFTRVAPDEIEYLVTAEDATTWVRPWTAKVRLMRREERIYEYACHEGNRSIEGMLGAK